MRQLSASHGGFENYEASFTFPDNLRSSELINAFDLLCVKKKGEAGSFTPQIEKQKRLFRNQLGIQTETPWEYREQRSPSLVRNDYSEHLELFR